MALDNIQADKEDWEKDQAAKKKELDDAGKGGDYEYEPWPEKEAPPKPVFEKHSEQFVVCLDTLGQDRAFSKDEIRFALETTQFYKNTWEENERKCLQSDIDWFSSTREFDQNYRDFFQMQDEERLTELLDEFLREEQDRKTANGDDEITDAEREELTKVFNFQQLTKLFYAPDALLEY